MNLSVENLTLEFGNQTLFSDLSFEVGQGQKVCLAGPSGCGKSSLLKSFAGLIRPPKGQILIDGKRLDEKSVWNLRRNISYVCQEPDLGQGVILEQLRQPFHYKANQHIPWSPQSLADYCSMFRLSETLLQKQTSELSGGEKQRLAIIIALLLQRPILLLDEPVSALDKESKQTLKKLLIEDTAKTILFVSHDEAVLDLADRTIELDAYRRPK